MIYGMIKKKLVEQKKQQQTHTRAIYMCLCFGGEKSTFSIDKFQKIHSKMYSKKKK